MPEFRYARGRILESIGYITKEMEEFRSDYSSKTYNDYASDRKLQKLIDRTIENILTALIEVCGTVLMEEDIMTESYTDVMRKIGDFFGLEKEDVETLARFAIQRNRLAHRYLNFRWQVVRFYMQNTDLLKRLLDSIYKYEKDKGDKPS